MELFLYILLYSIDEDDDNNNNCDSNLFLCFQGHWQPTELRRERKNIRVSEERERESKKKRRGTHTKEFTYMQAPKEIIHSQTQAKQAHSMRKAVESLNQKVKMKN